MKQAALLQRLPETWEYHRPPYQEKSADILFSNGVPNPMSITTIAGIGSDVGGHKSVSNAIPQRNTSFAADVTSAIRRAMNMNRINAFVTQSRPMSATAAEK